MKEKKIEKIGSLARNIIRIIGFRTTFEQYSEDIEETTSQNPTSNQNYNMHCLNAYKETFQKMERIKSEALMERHRHIAY